MVRDWFWYYLQQLAPNHIYILSTLGPTPNWVDIVCFRPKGSFTAIKCVYMVKRDSYNVVNFHPYSMWDITNTPSYKHNVIVVSHGIEKQNRQTPFMRLNKPPYWDRGSSFDTILSRPKTHFKNMMVISQHKFKGSKWKRLKYSSLGLECIIST